MPVTGLVKKMNSEYASEYAHYCFYHGLKYMASIHKSLENNNPSSFHESELV